MKKWKLPLIIGVSLIVLFLIARFALIEAHKRNELAADPSLANPELNIDPPLTMEAQPVNPDTVGISSETAPMNTSGTREAGIKAGAKFGFIKSFRTNAQGVTTIVFDEAKFLTGDEADKTSKDDAGCNKPNPPEDCQTGNSFTPNGFYIQNLSKNTTSFSANNNTVIRIIDMTNPEYGVGIRIGSLDDLKKLQAQDSSNRESYSDYEGTPFWLTFKNGVISEIEQQYIP